MSDRTGWDAIVKDSQRQLRAKGKADPRDARILALEAQVVAEKREKLEWMSSAAKSYVERDNWRKVAEGLAGALKEARVWAEWTDKHFDDIANTLAIDEAISTYSKAKAEEGK